MRRRQPIRVGEAIADLFENTPALARKVAEAKIPDLWPGIVGGVIASYTTRMELLEGRRLVVYLTSSVARHEIYMRREAITAEINRLSGMELVQHLIVK